MSNISAMTAQPLQPSPLPTATPPLMEGGLMVAIVVYLIKEGVGFFKQKDASEEKLMAILIEDVRNDRNIHFKQQAEMLIQLKGSHDKIALAIERMGAATTDINLALQMSKRTETEIFHALQQIQQEMSLFNEKLDRLTTPETANGKYGPGERESR
ncbi:hypothetical protein NIES2135_58050 [Leptolyngbya boryana NIES-2135]|jgi:hypothetical protein|uniref:Uncharacterized protein n=1 Tax=Leptolyngbya boryana NIES-2135 TaxID=1973484 RepID=A0A1Z4JQF1_LEPBY|nr:hypothetical protein [Leptolyngbya boryana]ULP29981.1 hypothetical protein MCP04_28805 [Leptolyngbya boryana IU 594]BAS54930.1 hypothetical protein LBWT_8300 [Leptolyngbya boryana IAM M-101]BAS61278.1 hypothetical protein LBDG_08300 [Leptolyngbya boryana dg5]BAY58930.1 hypothetical protein NIES2135_58050 [Leptolyngbya boryana NIES-2135]